MHFFTTLLVATGIIAPTFAGTTSLRAVEKYDGKVTGKFIVKLKDGASKATVIQQLKANAITHEWQVLNGFAADLSVDEVNLLRSSPDVELVSEDGIMHTTATITQTNATWGLARLSSSTKLTDQNPSYNSAGGAGVDIYIVDTGVMTTHAQFGGRARWGATFGGYPDVDGNGHGTHCAGTAAGSQYGVAKAANIIAVKVLSDAGSGAVTDIVSGINFILNSARASGRPSVACIPLGGGASTALDNAVSSLVASGVHVAVSAGSSNLDAGTTSPARAPGAITVGASTIADARASFSNFGSVIDVYAPGQNVISSWIGSPTATNNLSGTSMATCYVAGLIALLISINNNQSPAAMSTLIQSLSIKGALSGIPSGTSNTLAHTEL
ncbi:serine protease [Collybia nuda]|uniref:Serine protease n=1 Tax=Collybia nuda TaxID=64659 RepID=A0A9P5Y1K0_9AGAR|nr:serine protease [Collybia nuda]